MSSPPRSAIPRVARRPVARNSVRPHWRIYWRIRSEVPASGHFLGGLENRYPSLGGSRVRIPPPPPLRLLESGNYPRPLDSGEATGFGDGGVGGRLEDVEARLVSRDEGRPYIADGWALPRQPACGRASVATRCTGALCLHHRNVGLDEIVRHSSLQRTRAAPGSRPGPTPQPRRMPSRQKSQWGAGASSSVRKAPPTGAVMTLMSCAGCPDSFRTMCPRPSSTKP